MEHTAKRRFPGLNAQQLKIIALIFMTIDHIGAYAFEIPFVGAYYNRFRQFGRIAAPLFIFLLTDSIRHTRSKPKFLLRLYLAAVGTGLFVTVTNALFDDTVGRFRQANIFYDYFYLTLYILLIEEIAGAFRGRNWKRAGLCLLTFAGSFLLTPINRGIWELLSEILPRGMPTWQRMCILDLTEVFLNGPLQTEYGPVFTLMGILMYFGRNKYVKTAILLLFSLPFRFLPVEANNFLGHTPFLSVLAPPQCYMFLAAPFMLLYNGEKGKGSKWFFYIYYPTHRYVIAVIKYLYLLLAGT